MRQEKLRRSAFRLGSRRAGRNPASTQIMQQLLRPASALLIALVTLTLGGCLSAADPLPATNSTDRVGRSGTNRFVTPANQILTPVGIQVELPGMRPQVLGLSPDGQILITSGKTATLVVVDPVSGKILQRVALPSEKDLDPTPDAVSPNMTHVTSGTRAGPS